MRSDRRGPMSSLAIAGATIGTVILGFAGVGFGAALELMETGIAGLLVGVGPGAACTSREVLGIGVPQVTATMDCAAARDAFHARTGKYVSIITDGGMRTGGDVLALGRNVEAAMRQITANLPVGIEPTLVADQPVTVTVTPVPNGRSLRPRSASAAMPCADSFVAEPKIATVNVT